MRSRTRLALGALAIAPTVASAQSTFAELSAMWKRAQYDSVAAPLIRHRNAAPTNGGLRVDYMIATSLCRSVRDDYRHKGRGVSEYVFEQYSLRVDDNVRGALSSERDRCRTATSAPIATAPMIVQVERIPLWPAGVSARHAKEFYFMCDAQSNSQENGTVISTISDSIYFSRRAPLDSAALGERMAIARLGALGSRFRAKREGRFIIVVSANAPAGVEALQAAQLEPYLTFYTKRFALPEPEQFITIYSTKDPDQLAEVSRAIYDEKPPWDAIGYSNVADLSMIAVSNFGREGTMMHELMHLLLRSAMIDPPDWFDEGLAALYEVSRVHGDTIAGVPNWRGDLLATFGSMRPALRDLLATAPTGGRPSGSPAVASAMRYATARYLLFYLQERGVLREAVRMIRERPPAVALDSAGVLITPAIDARRLVDEIASLLQTDANGLQLDFDRWLTTVLPKRPERRC